MDTVMVMGYGWGYGHGYNDGYWDGYNDGYWNATADNYYYNSHDGALTAYGHRGGGFTSGTRGTYSSFVNTYQNEVINRNPQVINGSSISNHNGVNINSSNTNGINNISSIQG